LLVLELALRKRPLPQVSRWLAMRPFRRERRLCRVLRFAGILERRMLKDPSCLRSSLLCFWMAKPGSRFIVGVRRGEILPLEAHAWIESDGHAFSTAANYSEYQIIFEANRRARLPAASALG
jgi:hypothetical protein